MGVNIYDYVAKAKIRVRLIVKQVIEASATAVKTVVKLAFGLYSL